jgi:hypothetical protein
MMYARFGMYIYRNPHAQNYLTAQEQRKVLEAERQQISERLAWIEQRIAELAAYIKATAPVVEHDPGQFLAHAGLTKVCQIALERAGGWVRAQDVRQLLGQIGITLQGGYTNPMATLHATLRRVGDVYCDPKGDTYYAKKGTPPPQAERSL